MTSPSNRLRQARIAAGFPDATTAAQSLGVPAPTYISHENGSRGFRADSANKYARRFRVSAAWLLYGREDRARAPAQGFSESDVEPIDMKAYKAMSDNDKFPNSVAAYKSVTGAMSFGIRPGSILLIDLKYTPQTGDYVVATRDDRTVGTSVTMLRRLVGQHLISSADAPPERIDSSVTVRGKIIRIISDL